MLICETDRKVFQVLTPYMTSNAWEKTTLQGHECKHSVPNPASTINIDSTSE